MIPAGFDLNLLRVLSVLFEERSVTRAGERLGRTQSAVSNALARLRAAFGDPLLVRAAGGMDLTPKARDLAPLIAAFLERADLCFESDGPFDPASAQGVFRLGAPDRLGLPLLVPLVREMREQAPGIELDLVTADRANALSLIADDRLDLAIGWFERPPAQFRAELAFTDRLVCLSSRRHPVRADAPGPVSIDKLLGFPHLVVSSAGDRKAGFDDLLARTGIRRRSAISVTNFTTVPDLLAESDLVGVFTSRVADVLARRHGLAVTPLPDEVAALDHYVVWHARNDASVRHRWMRERLQALYGAQET